MSNSDIDNDKDALLRCAMIYQFRVDRQAYTVTHKPTGIVFAFALEPDGSWCGRADRVPTPGSADAFANIARGACDAWLEALDNEE